MKYLVYDNAAENAGLGHTYMCYNFPFYLSKKYKLELLMKNLRPNVKELKPSGSGKFEDFFGLDKTESKRLDVLSDSSIPKIIIPNYINKTDYEKYLDQYKDINDTVCFHIRHERNSSRSNALNIFTDTIHELRQKYKNARKTWPIRNLLDESCINVAVHIRRADILRSEKERLQRACSDMDFVSKFDEIKSNYSNVKLNIYTQSTNGVYINENSEPTDIVSLFNHSNTTLYINSNTLEAFDNISRSDVIIQGRTGFPYIASLMYDNCITYYVKTISGI